MIGLNCCLSISLPNTEGITAAAIVPGRRINAVSAIVIDNLSKRYIGINTLHAVHSTEMNKATVIAFRKVVILKVCRSIKGCASFACFFIKKNRDTKLIKIISIIGAVKPVSGRALSK